VLNFVVDDIADAVNTLLDGGVRLLRYEGLGLDMKGTIWNPDRDATWSPTLPATSTPCRDRGPPARGAS
jgi:hypothetical protein